MVYRIYKQDIRENGQSQGPLFFLLYPNGSPQTPKVNNAPKGSLSGQPPYNTYPERREDQWDGLHL